MSGLLILSSLVGIQPTESDENITFFDFSLAKAESLPFVFFIMTGYGLLQFAMAWFVQPSQVREARVNKIDLFITFAVGFFAIVAYFYQKPLFQSSIEWASEYFPIDKDFAKMIGAMFLVQIFTMGAQFLLGTLRKSFDRNLYKNENEILSLILNNNWMLWYNRNNENAKKDISFSPDGRVLEGNNENESFWRIQDNFLEILNNQKDLYSRFKYNKELGKFEHTNDPDTKSLKSQIIFKK